MARDMVRGMDEAWLKNSLRDRPRPGRGLLSKTFSPRTSRAENFRQKFRASIIGRAAWTSVLSRDMFDSFPAVSGIGGKSNSKRLRSTYHFRYYRRSPFG